MTTQPAQSLEELLAQSQLSSLESVRIALRLAEYLSSIHSAGEAYRHLCPCVVRIDNDQNVFLLAARPGSSLEPDLAYLAPEQARGANGDLRSDFWSLGVLLQQMLMGELAPAERVLSACLADNPDDRYQSSSDLIRDLRCLEDDLVSMASGSSGAGPVEEAAPRPEALTSRLRMARYDLDRREEASWWSLVVLPLMVLLLLAAGLLYCSDGFGT